MAVRTEGAMCRINDLEGLVGVRNCCTEGLGCQIRQRLESGTLEIEIREKL